MLVGMRCSSSLPHARGSVCGATHTPTSLKSGRWTPCLQRRQSHQLAAAAAVAGPYRIKTRMGLMAGIVGLPNVGKSTLFNALVGEAASAAANFPFCTIDPSNALVSVPDERLAALATTVNSSKIVPTAIEFRDIAGLVRGASKGEGLGNKFLSHIRESDMIVQVVRCFEDGNVVHVSGKVDPADDIETINLELGLRDLQQIEQKLERNTKSRVKGSPAETEALEKAAAVLNDGLPLRSADLTPEERELLEPLCPLTLKPLIYAMNVSETDLADDGRENVHCRTVRELAEKEKAETVVVSAQVEAELAELSEEERKEFLMELGIESEKDSGLGNLIRACYRTLGLQTYFTAGEKEVKAWTIRQGMTAPQAAGVIHTDFERGFICAETVSCEDLLKLGSLTAVKEKGLLRQEGKQYVVKEGDVMLFRFNV